MFSLKRGPFRRDPAPSRLAFRLKRHWRSASFRRSLTIHAPVATLLVALGGALAQPDIREAARDRIETIHGKIVSRPEFAVRRIEVRGASPEVEIAVREALAPWIGASSLAADAASIRGAVHDLGWVATASARLVAPETLIVTVTERTPAIVWRLGDRLTLLDEQGVHLAPLADRAERPDLPLIAGEGADLAVEDARAVFAAAGKVASRIRGLVRVGERRWDAMIEDGPRIMLPAVGAADAMGYAMALEAGESLLSREVTEIDLRLGSRPTLRLTPEAAEMREEEHKQKAAGKDA